MRELLKGVGKSRQIINFQFCVCVCVFHLFSIRMLSEFGILLLSELEKITDNDEVLRSLFGSTRIILDYDLLQNTVY